MTNYPILDAQPPTTLWRRGVFKKPVPHYGGRFGYTVTEHTQTHLQPRTDFAPAARSVSFGIFLGTANGKCHLWPWMNCDEWTVEAAGYCINEKFTNLIINRDGITAGRVFQFKNLSEQTGSDRFPPTGIHQVVSTNTFTDNVPHLSLHDTQQRNFPSDRRGESWRGGSSATATCRSNHRQQGYPCRQL